jgi:DNA-binding transcriptional MerR regulator
MFTVGDFARVAQVSKRLLRYYDEIDLFKPAHIEPTSGYRFYRAEQMTMLNRILALKDLGLTLEQIQHALDEHLSTEELQHMLMRKKAEVEQHLAEELRRIRHIESRLQSIRDDEDNKAPDVVLKHIPDQTVLSLRCMIDDFEAGMMIFEQMQMNLPQRLRGGFSSAFATAKKSPIPISIWKWAC